MGGRKSLGETVRMEENERETFCEYLISSSAVAND
jgi:hypothetical protein